MEVIAKSPIAKTPKELLIDLKNPAAIVIATSCLVLVNKRRTQLFRSQQTREHCYFFKTLK